MYVHSAPSTRLSKRSALEFSRLISIDRERVSRQGSSRQQAGEKKVSVTSITDRFFVLPDFEDLGCPQGEHYESPHAGIWSSEPRK